LSIVDAIHRYRLQGTISCRNELSVAGIRHDIWILLNKHTPTCWGHRGKKAHSI